MLGLAPAGQDAARALFGADAAKADLLRQIVPAALNASDVWQGETMLSLLPGEFQRADLLLKAEYKLIDNQRVMVVLTDVTGERRLEQKVESERHRLEMIVAAITDSRDFFDTVETFREFATAGLATLLGSAAQPARIARELYRQVHSFKGLLNQFSFSQTPRALHALEGQLERLRQLGAGVTLAAIAQALQAVPMVALLEADLALLRGALGDEFLACGERIVVTSEQARQLRQLADRLLRGEPIDITLGEIRQLLMEMEQLHKIPISEALGSFDRLLKQTAGRMEKEIGALRVQGGDEVWIDPQYWRPFLRSLTHVFRNAVVHGIEDPNTRLDCGKSEVGVITCDVQTDGRWLKLSIADDGAGVDVVALRGRAVSLALFTPEAVAALPDEQVMELIFLDNISTQQEASELAGRGVGLAVVRSETGKLGGEVLVRSTRGKGTQFLFSLPLQGQAMQKSESN